jgi:gliding motility-associated-like protein
MNMSRVLVVFLSLMIFTFYSGSQELYDNCSNAIQLCPSATQSLNNIGATSTLCPNCEDDFSFCFSGENSIWMTFTTNDVGGDVNIDFSNLQFQNAAGQGTSLQAAIIEATVPCVSSSYSLISNCENNGAAPFSLAATGLAPNSVFYVVVNGSMGASLNAEAEFDVLLSGTSVEQNPAFSIGTNATTICTENLAVINAYTAACNDSSVFTWFVNGEQVAETAAAQYVTTDLQNGDDVTAEITCFENSACPQTLTSNILPFTVLDFVLDAGPDLSIEQGESIILQGSSAVANINWSPSLNMSDPSDITPVVNPSQTTTYFLTGDNGTCTITDEVTITVTNSLEIPNTFSPNGDGVNETWEILGIEKYPNCNIQVFTRWGQLVFQSTGYSSSKRWNGTSKNGKELAPSAYYYVINLRSDDFPDPIKGTVSIIK